MNRRFLGQGWRFPILPDSAGRLGYTSGEENIEHSLRVLLQTSLGERIMRFDFGSRAPRMVFAPGGRQHLQLLETTIKEAVRDWEPRIELDDVRAESNPEQPEKVDVSIEYTVRATNTRSNQVFPYYLAALEAS